MQWNMIMKYAWNKGDVTKYSKINEIKEGRKYKMTKRATYIPKEQVRNIGIMRHIAARDAVQAE